jgi:hypothetical protein
MNPDDMTIEELDAALDTLNAQRLEIREAARPLMAARNRKIAARELHARLNPTPVMALPDQGRIERLRVAAGTAVIGTKVK